MARLVEREYYRTVLPNGIPFTYEWERWTEDPPIDAVRVEAPRNASNPNQKALPPPRIKGGPLERIHKMLKG